MVWIWLRIVNVGHLLWLLNDGASSLGDNDMEHGCISDDMRARQSSIMNHES